MSSRTFQCSRSRTFLERLARVMGSKAMTANDIAMDMHCDKSGLYHYLRYLMGSTPRQMHIAAYRMNHVGRGRYTALYKLGDGVDAECPMPIREDARQKHLAKQVAKQNIFSSLGL